MKRTACVFAISFIVLSSVAANAWAQLSAQSERAVAAELNATRPAFAALPARERQLQRLWLAANCEIGLDQLRSKLQRSSRPLDVSFVESYRMGPPRAELEQLALVERGNFAAFRDRIAGDDSQLFSPEVIASLRNLTEEVYISNALALRAQSYRSAAMNGVALTGSPRVLPWLRRSTPGMSDLDRDVATRAIRSIQSSLTNRR